jgi:hypothetical protein
MRLALAFLAVVALGLVWLAPDAALYGGAMAAREVQRGPAVLGGIALAVLLGGPRDVARIAGWACAGAAAAVLIRAAGGVLGETGWIPGEAVSRPERLLEVAWWLAIAALAWFGAARRWTGPVLAAVAATTRIGGYAQAFVPIAWEDTAEAALVLGTGILTAFAAGLVILTAAGWALSVVCRGPERWIAPRRVLAAVSTAAAIGHMVKA